MTLGSHIEHTLLSVLIADACFRNLLPVTDVPSSRDLRLRFLQELLAPYERNDVLEQCGIPDHGKPSQKVDTRVILPKTITQTPCSEDSFPEVKNFDTHALRSAFREKPADIDFARCLRILQCVNEIGSPNILDSLKLALIERPKHWTSQTPEKPIIEKLYHIHVYLDKQESRNHLLVAQTRYIKFCYFETYHLAVKALQSEKQHSLREMRKETALKRTLSYSQGLCKELPPKPHTESIHHNYKDLTPAEIKRRAPDIVKDEISRKIAHFYKVNEKEIRPRIVRYLREGRGLHYILQGALCLNPGLLILFPSWETDCPSLDLEPFKSRIDEKQQESLSRPIGMKESVLLLCKIWNVTDTMK
jgi:hypothetical protein